MIIVDLLIIKLLLSFIFGGTYIATTIWLSERYGSKIGGLLIGLPSTILITLIFITWTQSTKEAVAAIPIVPVALALNSFFVIAFIILYKYGRIAASIGGTFVWFVSTLPLVLIGFNNLWLSLFIAAIVTFVSITFLNSFPHRKLAAFKTTSHGFFFRVLFSGGIITIAVLFSKLLGPLWGGLIGSFPAGVFASLILLSKTHGIDYTASTARTIPHGSVGTILFGVAFYFIVPLYGIFWGVIISYLATLLFAVLLYKFVLQKQT